MKEICKGLFLGNIDDAVSCIVGDYGSNISHILSVVNIHLSDKAIEMRRQTTKKERNIMMKRELVRKEVPLMDSETQNILEHLEECLDFIECGRKASGVLVHCLQGLSRSASIVIGYVMRSERLSVKDALASVQLHNKLICPNYGFTHQLELFYEMNFVVDKNNPVHSRWNIDIDFSQIPRAPELSHCVPESKLENENEEDYVDGLEELFT